MDFSKYLKNETFKTIKNAVVFVVDPGTGSTLLHSAPMLDINLDLGNLWAKMPLKKKKIKQTRNLSSSTDNMLADSKGKCAILVQQNQVDCLEYQVVGADCGRRMWVFHAVPKAQGATGLAAQISRNDAI